MHPGLKTSSSLPIRPCTNAKKTPPRNLTCVYFFICIQHSGETLGTKVVKKHHQLKIAEIPLFDVKMVSVLPGYSLIQGKRTP